jgi:hypothetical protein
LISSDTKNPRGSDSIVVTNISKEFRVNLFFERLSIKENFKFKKGINDIG